MKRISKQVMAGNVKIGGGAPVTVQSMLNVPSTDIEGSVRQAVALEKAGCQILRAAIPDMDAVRLIPAIKEKISIPLVARKENSDPHRRQFRFGRKEYPRKVRRAHSGSAVRKRTLPRVFTRKVRFHGHRYLPEILLGRYEYQGV